MAKASLQERIRYHFDNYMSRGTVALTFGLAIISFLLILAAAVVITLFRFSQDGQRSLPFSEAIWETMLHSMDTGTLAMDSGWDMRMIMLVVTLGGIFILSALIGVLGNGLEMRLNELRKGSQPSGRKRAYRNLGLVSPDFSDPRKAGDGSCI